VASITPAPRPFLATRLQLPTKPPTLAAMHHARTQTAFTTSAATNPFGSSPRAALALGVPHGAGMVCFFIVESVNGFPLVRTVPPGNQLEVT